MRWLVACYLPVGLFSLKLKEATSTGAKTLLVPSPFSIRTALLDAAIRVLGLEGGRGAFESIRSLHLALRPPRYAVVTGLLTKVLKPEREKERDRFFQQTIAFREYVYLDGVLELALGGEEGSLQEVRVLLPHITYFGKRGSFFQFVPPLREVETEGIAAPEDFIPLQPIRWEGAVRDQAIPLGLPQRVDDWTPRLAFDEINIYTEARLDRKDSFDVILPYHLVRAGRGFAVYARADLAE